MNISIEARALSDRGSGVRTYTAALIENLLRVAPHHSYNLLYDKESSRGLFPSAREEVVPLLSPLLVVPWLNWQVPRSLRRHQVDIVHFTKAAIPKKKVAPTVVSIHDVIPILYPQSQSIFGRWYWPHALQHAANNADHIITISRTSKKDLMNVFSIPPERITVTPLAVNQEFFKPVTQEEELLRIVKKYAITGPYILFLGARDPRKNVGGLVRAFAQAIDHIPHQLVIVGKEGVAQDHALEVIKKLDLVGRVRVLDFVPFSELPALYTGADVFVWPSIYEGWGFPPLEAMACGTPVIVSNGGALPEVVGESGAVVPFSTATVTLRPQDEEFEKRLALAMVHVLTNKEKQAQLREAGFRQAANFSWEAVARQTLDVYAKVCQR